MDDTPQLPELVDFDGLGSRVARLVVPLVGLCLLGAIVNGLVEGLTFALLGRWLGILVLASLLAVAVTTAVHALGGADRANRMGERLSSADVGLAPRRFADAPGLGSTEAGPDGEDPGGASEDGADGSGVVEGGDDARR